MVKALRATGVEAEIATTNDDGNDSLDVPLAQQSWYENVPIWFFPRWSAHSTSIKDFSVSYELIVWLWHNLPRYDLVHVHALFSVPATLTMLLCRLKGIPYINAPHGLLCAWSLRQSTYKKTAYMRLVERANLNHSSGLHLNSQLEREEIEPLNLTAKTFVIPHGLSVPAPVHDAYQHLRICLDLPPDEPIFLFLSRLHPKKGLDFLIDAIAQLRAHQFTLLIAGSGDSDYEFEIQSLIRDMNLESKIRRVGFITGKEKELFLQGADLFVLTSHSENFGIAVLESLASATPVLITPGVALASVVQQNQLGYVTELDSDQIASALAYHLAHADKTKRIGQSAREFVAENYAWGKVADKLSKAYYSILTTH